MPKQEILLPSEKEGGGGKMLHRGRKSKLTEI